ncbi:hypothetical protein FKM82_025413 [Ascaphus truei]
MLKWREAKSDASLVLIYLSLPRIPSCSGSAVCGVIRRQGRFQTFECAHRCSSFLTNENFNHENLQLKINARKWLSQVCL